MKLNKEQRKEWMLKIRKSLQDKGLIKNDTKGNN